jgi:hypothetical protein
MTQLPRFVDTLEGHTQAPAVVTYLDGLDALDR